MSEIYYFTDPEHGDCIHIPISALPKDLEYFAFDNHDSENGIQAFRLGDYQEFFLGGAHDAQYWLTEHENYILEGLAAMLRLREIDAIGSASQVDRLAADLREADGNHDQGASSLAELLVAKGWAKK